MEFTNSQIARLVLGYLKAEHCDVAFREFLSSSKYFNQHEKARKHVATRVAGRTLIDILFEYANAYNLVQGRLESTNYYSDNSSKETLVDLVQYLLNKVQDSCAPSPCLPNSVIDLDSSSDVETTPVHTLPGNIRCRSEDSYLQKASNNELHSKKLNKSAIITTSKNDESFEDRKINKNRNNKECSTQEVLPEKSDNVNLPQERQSVAVSMYTETPTTSLRNENSVSKTVDEQNNETIQSILVASNAKVISKKSSNSSNNSEVIVFDGSLDNYLKTNNAPNIPNKLFLNSDSLLMVQPSAPPQFIVLNNQPTVQQSAKCEILTEEDIMAMPTVIVNDELGRGYATSVTIPENNGSKYRKIAPRVNVSDELVECFRSVGLPNQTATISVPQLTNVSVPQLTKTSEPQLPPLIPFQQSEITNDQKSVNYQGLLKTSAETTNDQKSINYQGLLKTVDEENKIKPIQSTPKPLESVQRNTPRSGSHVRNLDFSSPSKSTSSSKKSKKKLIEDVTSPNFVHKKQAAKALFKTSTQKDDNEKDSNTTKTDVQKRAWDADLRELAASQNAIANKSPSKKKARNASRTKRKPKKTAASKSDNLNTTSEEAKLVEAGLITPENNGDQTKIDKDNKEENIENQDETAKKEEKEENKVSATNNKKKKPRRKIIQPKTKSSGETNKLILSPSKVCPASKRNILKTDDQDKDSQLEEPSKLITPETSKLTCASIPMKAKRDISAMLTTPSKPINVPKTPGLETPFNNSILGLTPFTKVLDEHLQGIDINSIETPCLPITPNFPPLTPSGGNLVSPYSNRPTDYSTSSSYYQPSDTEQNKSLEQIMIEECGRLEVRSKEEKLAMQHIKTAHSPPIRIISNIVIGDKAEEAVDKSDYLSQIANPHLNTFNRGVIAKKNLNLVDLETSSSDSSSSSSNDSSCSGSSWCSVDKNETVIVNKRKSVTPPPALHSYSLRNRNPTGTNETEVERKAHEISNIIQSVQVKDILERKRGTPKLTNEKQRVLKELEEKRKRVLNKFKNPPVRVTKPRPPRTRNAKKPESTAAALEQAVPVQTRSSTRRKSASPRKAVKPMKHKQIKNLVDKTDEITSEDEISLYLSSDEETGNNRKISKKIAPQIKKAMIAEGVKSTSDVEAETLIHELKERGIHLMHNKAQKNSTDRSDEMDAHKDVVPDADKQSEMNNSVNDEDIVFDNKFFEGEDLHLVFDDKSSKVEEKIYDVEVLSKTFSAHVILDNDEEVCKKLICLPFVVTLDLASKNLSLITKKGNQDSSENVIETPLNLIKDIFDTSLDTSKEIFNKSDDDLMNKIVCGESSPKILRKRKNSSSSEMPIEKKAKAEQEILKGLDVEQFLTKVHGSHE